MDGDIVSFLEGLYQDIRAGQRSRQAVLDLAYNLNRARSVDSAEIAKTAARLRSLDGQIAHTDPILFAELAARFARALIGVGRHKEAILLLDAALPRLTATEDFLVCAEPRADRAQALELSGRLGEALAEYEALLPLVRSAGQPELLARCLITHGQTLQRLKRAREALVLFDEALTRFRDLDDSIRLVWVQIFRARALRALGRLLDALAACDEAIDTSRARGYSLLAQGLHERGVVLWRMERLAEAIDAYSEALPLIRRFWPNALAGVLRDRAFALGKAQREQEAVADMDEVITLLRRSGTLEDVGDYLLCQSEWLAARGQFREAADKCAEAAPLIAQSEPVSLPKCHLDRGQYLESAGDHAASLEAFEKALAAGADVEVILAAGKASLELARCRKHQGYALLRLGRMPEALARYDAALSVFRQLSPSVDLGECLWGRAGVLDALNRPSEALADCDQAAPLLADKLSPLRFALFRQVRAAMWARVGRLREAVAEYDAVIPVLREHKETLAVVQARLDRAFDLHHLGNNEEALREIELLLPETLALGARRDYGRALQVRSGILIHNGDYARAVADSERAFPVVEEMDDPGEMAIWRLNRAQALFHLGRLAEAAATYEQILTQDRERLAPRDAAASLLYYGQALHQLGRLAEAVEAYDEARRVYAAHGQPYDEAGVLLAEAALLCEVDEYDPALALLDEALPQLRAHDDLRNVGVCLTIRGTVLLQIKQNAPVAVLALQEGLTLLRQAGASAAAAACQFVLATALFVAGNLQDAQAAFPGLDTSQFSPDHLANYYLVLGMLACQSNRLGESREYVQQSRRYARAARHTGGIDDTSLEFVKARVGQVHEAVDMFLDADPAFAFELAQDGKAGVFSDLLTRRDRLPNPGVEVEAARRVLGKHFLDLHHGIRPDVEQKEKLLQRGYLRAFRIAMASTAPVEEPLEAQPGRTLAQVQAALPADWALLDFWQVDESDLRVFVVTRNGFRVVPLRPFDRNPAFRDRLHLLVRQFKDLRRRPEGWNQAGADEVWSDLFHHLMEPLLKDLKGVRGLYIVPHRLWHAVPLHAARWFDPVKMGHVYLADRYMIAYLPSAAMLPQLPPARTGRWVLSLANPDRGTPHTLPFAEWEAARLRKRLGADPAWFFAGEAADSKRVGDWSGFDLLHFSCHGAGDETFAALSRLYLHDDCLLAHDVLYRRPPLAEGATVVLNGCQTGVKDWRAVDEGMGLMAAFLLRGAAFVLATLWSVSDHCAAEMVTTFLQKRACRARATAALAAAQQRVRAMTPARMLGDCDGALRLFRPKEYAFESARINAWKTLVATAAGRQSLAVSLRAQATDSLRAAGAAVEADWVDEVMRDGRPGQHLPGGVSYRDPLYWAAFQLVGRVT